MRVDPEGEQVGTITLHVTGGYDGATKVGSCCSLDDLPQLLGGRWGGAPPALRRALPATQLE
jgi:hypothetical protein